MPMSYLYGIKFTAPENDLILSLREVGIPYHAVYVVSDFLTGIIPSRLLFNQLA